MAENNIVIVVIVSYLLFLLLTKDSGKKISKGYGEEIVGFQYINQNGTHTWKLYFIERYTSKWQLKQHTTLSFSLFVLLVPLVFQINILIAEGIQK